ncbi:MAG TPA: tetratricopeptide repeat protein, partial [Legionella sp.]|nr:tetratricopeptide repeat protein [Legionella sp.]
MIRGFIFLISMIISIHAKAFNWSDLWQTPDQQAQNLMDKGQFSAATQLFERIDWAAAAAYKAGKYDKAAQGFAQLPTENGFYNQGNALAHLGKYEQAITAYDKALAINPANQDALYNRKLVEELLKQSQQNKDQQNKDQQNKDQQNKDQQNKD